MNIAIQEEFAFLAEPKHVLDHCAMQNNPQSAKEAM